MNSSISSPIRPLGSRITDHSFFFTERERDTFNHVVEMSVSSPNLLTRVFWPFWYRISERFIPETVAPNAITLAGMLCTLQAFQVTKQYFSNEHKVVAWIVVSLLLGSVIFGCLDGVHAVRNRSATPLGDVFVRTCSGVQQIFFSLTLLDILEIKDPATRWYLVMLVEVYDLCTVLLQISGEYLGSSVFEKNYPESVSVMNAKKYSPNKFSPTENSSELGIRNSSKIASRKKWHQWYHTIVSWWGRWGKQICFLVQYGEVAFILVMILLLQQFFPVSTFQISLRWSIRLYTCFTLLALLLVMLQPLRMRNRVIIAACFAIRVIPLIAWLPLAEDTELSLIADALFIALLGVEVYVSHMAHRRINAAILLIAFGTLFNGVLGLSASVLYMIGMIVDLSYSSHVPLFVPIRNVFIDGVYDLCHIGHKRMMERALQHGNRLLIGVASDQDCIGYKRRPIMTMEERIAEVESCKYVYKAIPNSPISGLTEEFLRQHNIHVVVCGEEYNTPDDHYYAVPRAMGILHTLSRTPGMSTSTLIDRIISQREEDLIPKDKLRKQNKAIS